MSVASLVDHHGVRALSDVRAEFGEELAGERADGLLGALLGEPDRCWVLAIGSNRSTDVLAAKLAGTSGTAAMLPVRVTGLGVGHSAHVSRRGYLPAAPFDDPGGVADATAVSLTAEQVAALDATEPNYDRVVLDPDRYRVWPRPALGDGPASATDPDPDSNPDAGPITGSDPGRDPGPVWIYATRHPVLADGPEVLRLTSQLDVQSRLLEHPELRRLLPAAPGPELCDLLSEDRVRSAVTELLPLTLGARPAGLRTRPA